MALHEFFVIVPALNTEKHAEVRPHHLLHVEGKMAKLVPYRHCGEYFSPEIPSGQTETPYAGSALTVLAEDEADVKRQLEDDPFAKTGVWDVAAARIFHFRTGVSTPVNNPIE